MHINQVIGFQQFTSNALTGVQAVSTALLTDTQSGQKADAAVISIGGSTGAVRFRDDGAAPTSNIGMRLPTGSQPFLYTGDLHKIKFIVDSVPGNADVNIAYVKINDT
jgi:hypothetical protein